MTDARLQCFDHPYEPVEQHLDADPQTLPPPSNISQRLRRRKVSLLFGGLFLLALSVLIWRSFQFSLPMPDFPFKLTGSASPSCALQQLLDAARFHFVVVDNDRNAVPSLLIPSAARIVLPTTTAGAA